MANVMHLDVSVLEWPGMSRRRKAPRRPRTKPGRGAAPDGGDGDHPVTSARFRARPKRLATAEPAYASFWRRLAAWIIDATLTLVVIWIASALLDRAGVKWISEPINSTERTWLNVLFVGSPLLASWLLVLGRWLYTATFQSSRWQATPGKRVLSVIVTDVGGARISFARATARYFATYLSNILLIGYLMQPFTRKRQTLHDRLAGTLVVDVSPPTSA